MTKVVHGHRSVSHKLQLAACHLDADFTVVWMCPEMLRCLDGLLCCDIVLHVLSHTQEKTLMKIVFLWCFVKMWLGCWCWQLYSRRFASTTAHTAE